MEYQMSDKEAMAVQLEALLHTYDFKKAGKAAYSLVSQFIKNGQHDDSLTQAQWNFVKSLVTQATKVAPPMETETVGDFSGVIELFKTAKLKYPKVTIDAMGNTVQLSLAGAKAKKPGTINVTDGGKYPDNTWYGRVDVDGTWEKSYNATDEVGQLLKALSENPAGFATMHGKKHGNCCFCAKTLTHDNSLAAGFGPVCAENWGLKAEWTAATK
jgi:hypothetical protein